MKRKLLTTLLILAGLSSSAQHVIKGKVINENGQPISSASIILQQKSVKTILQTSITDTMGVFVLIPKQTLNYQLLFNAAGFESSSVDLPAVLNQDTALLIRLTSKGQQLKQVSVYAKTPLIERKTDRILFNVENSLSAIGGDGVDALSKAPGIRINDNGINIVGKNAVRIMVNDRLIQLSGADLISYIKSIPASNIKRIEIITNPGARYEADGNSGLINIVLKKNLAKGFNGTINTGGILASRHAEGLTGVFNYNLEKLHISSNFTGVASQAESSALTRFSASSGLWERQTANYTKFIGLRGDVRADYDLSSNTTAGVKYMEGEINYKVDLNEQGQYFSQHGNRLDSTLLNKGRDEMKYSLRNFEFYIDHKIDTAGKKIEFASNYFRYGTDDDNLFKSSSYGPQQLLLNNYLPIGLSADERIEIFTNKLDLTLPYKFASLEFGGKISNIKSKNNLSYNEESITGILNNNVFNYIENTQSLYGSAEKDFNKWSMKLGLRMERTQTMGSSSVQAQLQKNNYTQLFPTVYLKHNLDKNNILAFTYGRRINRPDYSQLNPARVYSAVNVYDEGNPYLKPSFSNNFELNYTYKDWLNTSFYTNFISNGFSSLNFFDAENNIQSTVRRNFANSMTTGLSETITFNSITWWESNNQFNVYFERSKSTGAITEGTLRQWSGYISTDNTFTLNTSKTLMASTTFWYQFPEVSNRLISEAYYAADFSLRAMFMERKLTLAINIFDAFKTSRQKYNGLINGVNQFSTQYRDNRKTRIAFIYRFGNSKGNRAARNTDDAETNRVKQGG